MKKVLILFMALVMCFMLCACGSEKNPDHEYILSLLENGDYDMAIQVIEHLKAKEGGTQSAPTQEIPAPQQLPAPELQAPAATEQPAAPVSGGFVDLTVQTVNDFMAGKGGEMSRKHMEISGEKENPIQVTHAMEYTLPDFDGNKNAAHYLMIWVCGWFNYGDTSYDSVQLALDLDSGTVLDSSDVDWELLMSLNGNFTEARQFQMTAVSCYHSYISDGQDIFWSEMETINPLSDGELAAVNTALA